MSLIASAAARLREQRKTIQEDIAWASIGMAKPAKAVASPIVETSRAITEMDAEAALKHQEAANGRRVYATFFDTSVSRLSEARGNGPRISEVRPPRPAPVAKPAEPVVVEAASEAPTATRGPSGRVARADVPKDFGSLSKALAPNKIIRRVDYDPRAPIVLPPPREAPPPKRKKWTNHGDQADGGQVVYPGDEIEAGWAVLVDDDGNYLLDDADAWMLVPEAA